MENHDNRPEDLTPRQWWLYRLLKWATLEQGRKLSISEIIEFQEKVKVSGRATFDNFYTFKDADGNHSNCPEIYKDKDAINSSDRLDKIVVVKNNEFWLGNESEIIEYHNKLMHNVQRDSHKCKVIRDTISQEGQVKLFTWDYVPTEESQGRAYHECFARNETLTKEIDKLKEQIKYLKNENQMWKERYEYMRDKANGIS